MVTKAKKERSPAYPFISLDTAIKRLIDFDDYFGRHPAPAAKAGLAWGMKEKSSQAFQTIAALKSYGLLHDTGMGDKRTSHLTDDARKYLRSQQERIKIEVLQRCALKPKAIAKYWEMWGADRPPEAVCLDQLVLEGGFTQSAANTFLQVYDDTIEYAGLSKFDKTGSADDEDMPVEEEGVEATVTESSVQSREIAVPAMPLETGNDGESFSPGEMEKMRGPLSSSTSYRLIIRGDLGPREIGKLIKLLEAQKAVLSDDDEEI